MLPRHISRTWHALQICCCLCPSPDPANENKSNSAAVQENGTTTAFKFSIVTTRTYLYIVREGNGIQLFSTERCSISCNRVCITLNRCAFGGKTLQLNRIISLGHGYLSLQCCSQMISTGLFLFNIYFPTFKISFILFVERCFRD